MRDRIIKLSDDEYKSLEEARKALVYLGAGKLSESLKNIVEEALNRDSDQLALGVIVKLSANALIFALADAEKSNAKQEP